MDLKKYASWACIIVILASFAVLLVGCKTTSEMRFTLEKVPNEYRVCASKVVDLPDGPLTLAQLSNLSAKLRRSELKQHTCLKGVIAWADAQHRAYYRGF